MLILSLLTIIVIASTVIVNSQIIEIPNGKIQGSYNGIYYSFRSIPYAEPPINSLRFKPPQPYIRTWGDKIRDCRNKSKSCLRWEPTSTNNNDDDKSDYLIGDEDCLYLNIYTPEIHKTEKSYPVILYIHGGGFTQSSGDTFNEYRLMKRQSMILVTFNYRLGPLGFLSTGDIEISGNMGLKDQQLAMQWIKYNIHLFNGNPNEILLLGWSAGGMSVHYHMANKKTKYLINAAISMSGNGFLPYAISNNPLENTKLLVNFLKCPNTNDTKEIRICLQNQTSENIVRTMKYFKSFINNRFRVFVPVIESNLVQNPFISNNLDELYYYGNNISKIPWLISYTMNDAANLAANLLKKNIHNNLENLQIYKDNFNNLTPILLFYYDSIHNENEQLLQKTNDLKKQYEIFQSNKTSDWKENYNKIEKMFTYEIMIKSIQKTIQLHRKHGDIYAYVYNYPAPFGFGNIVANRTDINFGSVHGDDICLILECPSREKYPFTDTEEIISEKFMNLLENFAKTRIPNYYGENLPKILPTDDYFKILQISG